MKKILISIALLLSSFAASAQVTSYEFTYINDVDYAKDGYRTFFFANTTEPCFSSRKSETVGGVADYIVTSCRYLNSTLSLDGAGKLGVASGAFPTTADLTTALSGKANASHTHVAADISDSTSTGRAVLTATSIAAARTAIGAGTSSFDGSYTSLTSIPSSFAPSAHNQAWSTITSRPTTLSGYGITDAAGAVSLTTTGSGAATYNSGTGVLNVPTPASSTPFNYGAPTAKTVAVSTAYQAADNTKAAVITVSPSCQNATTLLASSACTLQLRQSASSGLNCANGTVASTWTSTVQLGLVFTQSSGSPFDVKLPSGGYFVLCATAGTFTISAVEQVAG